MEMGLEPVPLQLEHVATNRSRNQLSSTSIIRRVFHCLWCLKICRYVVETIGQQFSDSHDILSAIGTEVHLYFPF